MCVSFDPGSASVQKTREDFQNSLTSYCCSNIHRRHHYRLVEIESTSDSWPTCFSDFYGWFLMATMHRPSVSGGRHDWPPTAECELTCPHLECVGPRLIRVRVEEGLVSGSRLFLVNLHRQERRYLNCWSIFGRPPAVEKNKSKRL